MSTLQQPNGSAQPRRRDRYQSVVLQRDTSIRDLIDDLEAALLRRERSPRTVATYRWALKDLVTFADAAGIDQAAAITEELLEDWQDSLLARELAPSSRNVAMSAAKALIRLGSKRHVMSRELEDAIEPVNVPENEPKPLADVVLARVLAELREAPLDATPIQLRDRAVFLYLLTTGARVSELLRVRRDDYERPVVRQKGRTQKKLYPPPWAIAAVAQYHELRGDDLPDCFVTHERGVAAAKARPLRPAAVLRIWVGMAKRWGLPHFTTHMLRHTSATVLSDAEVPDLVIADHLGHHGLATLPNYAKVSERRRSKVVGIFEDLVAPPPPPAKVLELRPYRKPVNKKRRRRR